jgi:hypothetical protein
MTGDYRFELFGTCDTTGKVLTISAIRSANP